MVKIMPAAPINGPAVLPDALIEQYVKPNEGQTTLVDAFRLAALGWVEKHTARSLARRNWIAMFDGFSDPMILPCEPVRTIVSLSYMDADGDTVHDGSGLWLLVGSRLVPALGCQWPPTGNVTVLFEAGYDNVSIEAPGLQIAALMLMKHLFDGGSLNDVPATVSLLIDEAYRTPVMG